MFRVLPSARQSVFLRAVVALIGDLHPDWTLEDGQGRPDPPGESLLPRLEHIASGRWIAVLPGDDEVIPAAEALVAGAAAVITGSSTLEEVEEALQAAMTQESVYVPAHVARALARNAVRGDAQGSRRNEAIRLSTREVEVLQLLARGLSNNEIANELSISVNTVRSHMQALSSKMNVSGRAGLTAAAWRHGWNEESNEPAPKRVRGADRK
jgi:two-component system NarL family response regulator